MASELFDALMDQARRSERPDEGGYLAQLAGAEALGRIADVLEWMREDYLQERDGKEAANANPTT